MHYSTDHLSPMYNQRLTNEQRDKLQLLSEITGASVNALVRQAVAESLLKHEQMIAAARGKKSA